MAKICIPLMTATTAETLAEMKRLGPLADLFELRLDAMSEYNLRQLLAHRLQPVIVTNRAASEGGLRQQEETERLVSLVEAIQLGADFVDVELASLSAFKKLIPAAGLGRTKLIVSFHDFARVPDDLVARARTIEDSGADVVKVVGRAKKLEDNLRIFDVLRAAKKPTIALAMGELGQLSRVLAGKFAGLLTFASGSAGGESAAGQITAEEMRNLYRAERIGPATRVYAVMGNPVGHSLSPAIHNAAFAAEGLDAVYVRLKVEGDPAAVVRDFAAIPIDGYSVTIPHKEAVMAACAEIDPLARKMRAVNTLVRRSHGYYATNTDITAAMKALVGAVGTGDFTGQRALVVGAGGVGRAFVHGLASRGAKVFVTDVDPARRDALAAETGAEAISAEAVAKVRADILMNATPIGMWPQVDASPVDARVLRRGLVVFDAVYNPLQTRLLREAEAAGCTTVSGVEQFVGQAVEQFELWTGRQAPAARMRQVVLEALARR
jgi:3-dehydroquinate dehydratase/shikimate dehydrogenase